MSKAPCSPAISECAFKMFVYKESSSPGRAELQARAFFYTEACQGTQLLISTSASSTGGTSMKNGTSTYVPSPIIKHGDNALQSKQYLTTNTIDNGINFSASPPSAAS
jgi:hypothetical protein